MGREIVDIALIELTDSEGSRELETVVSMSLTKNDPKTPVKVMRRKRRALGFTRGVADFGADLEVVYPVGEPEVDWNRKRETGEKFLLTYEMNEGGKRRSLIDCVVGDMTEPFTENGETKVTVKVMALDDRAED